MGAVMKLFLLVLSAVLSFEVAQGCDSAAKCAFSLGIVCDPRTRTVWRKGPEQIWDEAMEGLVQRIDRAIPEFGLLTDRQGIWPIIIPKAIKEARENGMARQGQI